jgi:hypothetical protein
VLVAAAAAAGGAFVLFQHNLQGWRYRSRSRSRSPSMPPLPPGAPPLEGDAAAAAGAGDQQQQQQQQQHELPYLQMATLMFSEGKLPSGCKFNSTIGMYHLDGR